MREKKLRKRLEGIWWVFTFVVVIGVLAPIAINRIPYPFYLQNIIFIVLAITASRYIFLLKHTWLARNKWAKIILTALSAIAIFVMVTYLGDFNNYVEEVGLQELTGHLPVDRQYSMIEYIQKEMLFFGVCSIIALAVLPVRMIISIWRVRNTPDKV